MSPATAGIAQQITLLSAEPPIRVTGLRGADPPTVTGGYGGWAKVARPRKKALTEWGGVDPLELRVPMLFDGFGTTIVNGVALDESVELQCARLEQLAGLVLTPVGGRNEPPILRVIGVVPHSDGYERDWVIEALEWVEPMIFSEDGFRTRQAVNVSLLEYVADDRIQTLGAAEQARLAALEKADQAARKAGVGGQPPAHAKHYTVRRGDTLSSIAAAQLGDYRRWPEIADLNRGKIGRNPRRVKVGTVLRLP